MRIKDLTEIAWQSERDMRKKKFKLVGVSR
jgi:hypothetical protein